MIWNTPNVLSLARLMLFLPVLWALAILHEPHWLGAVLMLALATDALDGYLARAWDQVTAVGAKLDSVADAGIVASAIIWLLMLRPEVLLGRTAVVLVISVGLWLTALAVGWIRFRRFANLHLYSHKITAAVGGVFLVVSFLSGFHPWLFYLAAGASATASLEAIILLATRDSVDEHMGTVFRKGAMN